MPLTNDQHRLYVEAFHKRRNELGDNADKWIVEEFLFKKTGNSWIPTTNVEKRAILVGLIDIEKQRLVAEKVRIARNMGEALDPSINLIDEAITNL